MDRQPIAAGWLTLRPFNPADIPWVYEVLLDPVLQRFMQLPSPYRLEDAANHVEQEYIAGGDDGRRANFLAEDAATGTRLGRVGLRLGEPGAAEIGYWVDPRARNRGVATTAVQAVCRWAVTTAGIDLIEWRCEAGNTASRRVAEKTGFLIEATLRKRRVRAMASGWTSGSVRCSATRKRWQAPASGPPAGQPVVLSMAGQCVWHGGGDECVVGPDTALVAGEDPRIHQDLEVVGDGRLGQAQGLG